MVVRPDGAELAVSAAEWVASRCCGPAAFHIALAGGTTPRALYQRLAEPPVAARIDWHRWHVWFGDERAVAPDDPRSNLHMAEQALLSRVDIPRAQVHRMEAERSDLDGAAADYATALGALCGVPPRLDLILLGLGEDGHTASLFPGTPALAVKDTWAARGRAVASPRDRITLTLPTINNARAVAFLVSGRAKQGALRGVVAGSVPAACVRPRDGDLLWFLDEAAALALTDQSGKPAGGLR